MIEFRLIAVFGALNAYEHGGGTGCDLQPLADVLFDEFVGRALNDENRVLHLGQVRVRTRAPVRAAHAPAERTRSCPLHGILTVTCS